MRERRRDLLDDGGRARVGRAPRDRLEDGRRALLLARGDDGRGAAAARAPSGASGSGAGSGGSGRKTVGPIEIATPSARWEQFKSYIATPLRALTTWMTPRRAPAAVAFESVARLPATPLAEEESGSPDGRKPAGKLK